MRRDARTNREARGAMGCPSHTRPVRRLAVFVFLPLMLAGCVVLDSSAPQVGGPVYVPGPPPRIPPGHMPPPGSCRIWFPDRPPGQQPPPGPCEQLQYQVSPGAYLIRG
jgi:hypothetical protein